MTDPLPPEPSPPAQEAAQQLSAPLSKQPREFPVVVVVAAVVFASIAAALIFLARRPGPPPPPPPTQEAYDYLSQLSIFDIRLSVADNLLGHEMVYVDASILNNGQKTVTALRLRVYFYDYSGKLVLREEQDVIAAASPPLAAGERREFQLRFDTLPRSWNKQPPQFQLVSLQFQ